MRNKLTTWNTGSVAINGIPGKNYQLVIQRQGYNDRIITVGAVEDVAADGIEIALIPSNVKRLKQSGIDLTGATIVVMSGPTGEEQLYLSTTDELYEYSVENDNHFLIKDGEKILLKERTRPMNSKVNAKQDSDQFNLRTEDQFLYDQLSADEKAMIDQIIAHAKSGTDLSETPELSAYYNNLPPEYRALLDYMTAAATKNARVDDQSNDLALSESLDHALAENGISISGVFDVNNIYYDFDKSSIREDAARELDKLVLIMKNNKNIKVSMFSHTDSRGSNAYNVGLSKRRGQAAVNYLVERGISIDRFNTEARGEAQLVNSCGDQIQCDEQAHQLNRRTEFTLSA
jgi:outer membrane protein OmpA-like peptidoglycan-associated protein